jgi:hypothetical protein
VAARVAAQRRPYFLARPRSYDARELAVYDCVLADSFTRVLPSGDGAVGDGYPACLDRPRALFTQARRRGVLPHYLTTTSPFMPSCSWPSTGQYIS